MKKSTSVLVILSFASMMASPANADLTPVNGNSGPNGAAGEWNLYDTGMGTWPGSGIMEYLYGAGHFSRIDDSLDTWWISGDNPNAQAGVLGVYAGASQNLYTTDLAGSILNSVVNPLGTIGLAPQRFFNGPGVPLVPGSQPLLFLDDAVGYSAAYSDPLINGGIDRMVTLGVTGYLTIPGDVTTWTPFSDGTIHYVIGFEDYDDFDYQDLVVEVSGVSPVPELSGPILFGLGAAVLLIFRRRK
jgi:hypothetical protein